MVNSNIWVFYFIVARLNEYELDSRVQTAKFSFPAWKTSILFACVCLLVKYLHGADLGKKSRKPLIGCTYNCQCHGGTMLRAGVYCHCVAMRGGCLEAEDCLGTVGAIHTPYDEALPLTYFQILFMTEQKRWKLLYRPAC